MHSHASAVKDLRSVCFQGGTGMGRNRWMLFAVGYRAGKGRGGLRIHSLGTEVGFLSPFAMSISSLVPYSLYLSFPEPSELFLLWAMLLPYQSEPPSCLHLSYRTPACPRHQRNPRTEQAPVIISLCKAHNTIWLTRQGFLKRQASESQSCTPVIPAAQELGKSHSLRPRQVTWRRKSAAWLSLGVNSASQRSLDDPKASGFFRSSFS